MSERAQIPRIADVLAGGVEALLLARPHAAQFLSTGRYGDLFQIWKAQVKLALFRLADECKASRVPLAEGMGLRDLLASEFDAATDPSPQKAIGRVTLFHHNTTASVLPGGLIRAGTRFYRSAIPTSSPPVQSAEYETAEPVFAGSLAPSQSESIDVRISAIQPGTAANIQPGDPSLTIGTTLFDSYFGVVHSDAAGGSDGVSTAKLRSLAQAISLGQYGPTASALIAGALLTQGVSRTAAWDFDDPNFDAQYRRGTGVWIADDSWCYSEQLAATCLQNMRDKWLGFGCKAWINQVVNVPVSLAAQILLRDKRYVADTVEIADNVRSACLSYLNDRMDWWTWKERAIAARIVASDRRILAVPNGAWSGGSTGVVLANVQYGTTVAEPTTSLPDNPFADIYHYDLDTTNAQLTFLTPGASY